MPPDHLQLLEVLQLMQVRALLAFQVVSVSVLVLLSSALWELSRISLARLIARKSQVNTLMHRVQLQEPLLSLANNLYQQEIHKQLSASMDMSAHPPRLNAAKETTVLWHLELKLTWLPVMSKMKLAFGSKSLASLEPIVLMALVVLLHRCLLAITHMQLPELIQPQLVQMATTALLDL